jgi:hypothetical protein
MSKRQSGCLAFLFGSCGRKKEKKRVAVSVEHRESNRNKEIATQTQDQVFRSSAPASFPFSAGLKPTIAVRDSNGFKVQSSGKDRLVIKNEEGLHDLASLSHSEDIESIKNDPNNDPLLSSRSIQRLFSPSSQGSTSRVLPDPFKWDTSSTRPKLKPITPQQFLRKKLAPMSRPCKPVERILQGLDEC